MEIKHVYISDLNTQVYLCKENTHISVNWTVIMPKDVLEDVKRHPEQYAIVKLIYD